MSADRVLVLHGVHNFRDFGGYAVAGGGRLKRGVLWRSGHHWGASDSDLEKIAGLKLDAVFDLRSSQERTAHPCRRPEGFAAAVRLAADAPPRSKDHAAPHVAAAQMRKQRDAASARAAMERNYGGIAYRPEIVTMIRAHVAALTASCGPSLVNCMAGKDRTGIAVVALHLALGVHRDDIFADYLLTNTAGDVEARIAAGIATLTASSGITDPDVLRVLMGVEPEYLESAFAAMAEKNGSTDGYLRDVLGVDDAVKDRLRAVLVEG